MARGRRPDACLPNPRFYLSLSIGNVLVYKLIYYEVIRWATIMRAVS